MPTVPVPTRPWRHALALAASLACLGAQAAPDAATSAQLKALADRLQALESHVTHLERLYEELNEVVISQGKLLKRMQAQQQRLLDAVGSEEVERIRENNPKPPHH